ncbi:nuclear transport factor 2 family protein [Streptomyces hebeiensis]
MSRDDIVRAVELAYTGYEKNDMRPLVAMLSPDFEFEMTDSLPYGGKYVGPDQYVAFWREVGKEWESFSYEANEIIVTDESIIVPVKTDGLSKKGIRMRNEHLFHFKYRDGQIVWARLYADSARGRDVIAGLEPQRFPALDLRPKDADTEPVKLPVNL